ncbi:MAG: 3-phosphoshikimate 1-carboxyvinyltransferase [Prevotellaceae bacterium]|jgi:3-phosphoshikimate 1-carboxyvinyltransferase|nr:3-phosphoshikimate 1-carboxyvinyltransferase [Prevotellaceae bacterium]
MGLQLTIHPSGVKGAVAAPASKSVAQRAIAASLLVHGETVVTGYTESDDSLAALDIIQNLGARVAFDKELKINGNPPAGKLRQISLNCGESGLSSRLFAPLSLLYSRDVTINGRGSLLQRPFGSLMKCAFEQMGIKYGDIDGRLPVRLCGELSAKELIIDGSHGSQFLSGVLMTLPLLSHDSIVTVRNLRSKPYIDLTLEVLSRFGIEVRHSDYEVFRIKGKQTCRSGDFHIEGDWSGASCLLVAGAIAGDVEMVNLNCDSHQADRRIMEVLKTVGAVIEINNLSVKVSKNELHPFTFDATDSPDLFPALVALAVNCHGVSEIKGISRLSTKESNRALTLQSEFNKLGSTIELRNDYMIIHGARRITGAFVNSHNDHRIAMALATAALNSASPVTINNAECVNKSYPCFWKDMEKVKV